MKNWKVLLLVLALLIPTFISSAQASTAKVGSPCLVKELHKKVVVSSNTLICTKTNGKYRWVSIMPTNTVPPTVVAPNQNNLPASTTVTIVPNVGVVINPNASQTLDIWEDMQCPYCAQFETIDGKDLAQVIASGNYKVTFHIVNFLGDNSTVLGNVVYCAIAENKFFDVKNAIHQEVNSGILTEDSPILYTILNSFILPPLGLTDTTFNNCVNSGQYTAQLNNTTSQMTAANIQGTPAVFLNGQPLDNQTQLYDENGFKTALGLNVV
jgi:protein-disulfide isomerase